MESTLRLLLDRNEIVELGARATRLLNDQEIDAYVACYTEDGSFQLFGLPPAVGRAAIGSMMKQAPGVMHMTLDAVIEVHGDEATMESNLLGTWARIDRQACGFLETGRYRDRLIRTPDGWKFRERRLSLDVDFRRIFGLLEGVAGSIDRDQWRRMSALRWDA